MNNRNYILQYYQGIKDGTIVVGRWVLMLYEYITQGLQNKTFFLDLKKANTAIKFFECFTHHSKGRLAPQLVKLELWQKAMLSCIFGIVDANGDRQFREVFCVVGRKVGKSLLASGIAEYMVYADGEYGADAFFLAPRLEQTDIVFNDFWQSVSSEPDLMAMTKKRKTDIYIERTNSSVKKIAFSQKKSDGFNPHLTICDEIAAWQGDAGLKQYEVMTSALGSRKQPLIVSITTANYISGGIYDELFKRSTSVLMGNSKEKRLLPFLYQIDDVRKWNDLEELQKALPNLGVLVSYDFIIEEIAKAEGSLVNQAEFLCKYACIKQNSSQAWLSADVIDKASGCPLKFEDFTDCYAVCGIDLSRTTDLTACVCVIERDGIFNIFAQFFLPSAKLEEATARDGLPYMQYVQRGILKLSGENNVDYHDCYEWMRRLIAEYKIYPLQTGYDRYSAQYLIQDLNAYGFHTDDVFQGYNLGPVINEVEGFVKDGLFNIGDNDILKIHMLNSALQYDNTSGRCKLIKINANDHIDGMAATLNAFTVRQKYYAEMGQMLKNER